MYSQKEELLSLSHKQVSLHFHATGLFDYSPSIMKDPGEWTVAALRQ